MAATYPQEKVPLTAASAVDAESQLGAASPNAAVPARCCRRTAARHAAGCALVSFLVLSGLLFTLGASPLASMRRCHQHAEAVAIAPVQAAADTTASTPLAIGHEMAAQAALPAAEKEIVVILTPAAAAAPSAFQRLMEAVSSESLHKLLHTYMPDTYKHGVFDSEKAALEAIHQTNAPLATSLAHLARRDGNATASSSTPLSSSTPPTSSTPLPTTSSSDTSSTTPSSSPSTPTTSSSSTSSESDVHTTPTTTTSSSSSTRASSSRTTTNTFTSTINGTPVVVTATSIVGVSAPTTDSSSSAPAGSLQTGAAAPAAGHPGRAAGVAGVLAAGAMLLI